MFAKMIDPYFLLCAAVWWVFFVCCQVVFRKVIA